MSGRFESALDGAAAGCSGLPGRPDWFRELLLQGGAVYDTLVAQAAECAGVTGLVTLNARRFARLGEDDRQPVVALEA